MIGPKDEPEPYDFKDHWLVCNSCDFEIPITTRYRGNLEETGACPQCIEGELLYKEWD